MAVLFRRRGGINLGPAGGGEPKAFAKLYDRCAADGGPFPKGELPSIRCTAV